MSSKKNGAHSTFEKSRTSISTKSIQHDLRVLPFKVVEIEIDFDMLLPIFFVSGIVLNGAKLKFIVLRKWIISTTLPEFSYQNDHNFSAQPPSRQ